MEITVKSTIIKVGDIVETSDGRKGRVTDTNDNNIVLEGDIIIPRRKAYNDLSEGITIKSLTQIEKIKAKYAKELAALGEQEKVDITQEVQTRLNEDLDVTSKIIVDVYLSGLHYVQTEDGKYYIVPDSNGEQTQEISKEVTQKQIIKPFRTIEEWKKAGIEITGPEKTLENSEKNVNFVNEEVSDEDIYNDLKDNKLQC